MVDNLQKSRLWKENWRELVSEYGRKTAYREAVEVNSRELVSEY
jgi:hypothetical protein